MNTAWAAYGIFEDQEKGTISPGKTGDFAVPFQDPDSLRGPDLFDIDIDIEATILGGEVALGA
jgi:predicted amidohydrolase YtcJ